MSDPVKVSNPTPLDDLRERIARTIHESRQDRLGGVIQWDDADNDRREWIYGYADAILAVLAEDGYDRTGVLLIEAADEYGEVKVQAIGDREGDPTGSYWVKVIESETKRLVSSAASCDLDVAAAAALAAAREATARNNRTVGDGRDATE